MFETCRMSGLTHVQFCVGHQTDVRDSNSTITTSGARDFLSKNSVSICGDVRILCNAGRLKEAVSILNQEVIWADCNTYVCVLEECINMKGLAEGKQVHAHIIQSGLKANVFLHKTLLKMYAKCGSMVDAHIVFNNMPERDIVSWNMMIAGYAKHGDGREGLQIYEQMQREGVKPNRITFTCVLNACTSLCALEKGKAVHADMIKSGIARNIVLETALINMYAKCGSMKNAHKLFNNMAQRDVVSWNAMIAGYSQHGRGMEAVEVYEHMQQEQVLPDRVTFICVLNACANLGALDKGKQIHAAIIKAGIGSNINLENTLVDMYGKCGSMEDALRVFDNMARRDVVSWNAMITGFAQHGCGIEAFDVFEQMQREFVRPDRVTFICVLNACASLGALEKGKEVHAHLIKSGIVSHITLETALVDMYAKCGSMEDASEVFNNMAQRDVVTWSAMIAGCAQHGCARKAFEMYEQMQLKGVTPNQVTFLSVLNVCANLGALEKGREVHAHIIKTGIMSDLNLDTALVDMYAKCGSMDGAHEVFDQMAKRDVVSWNTMIAGCAQHGCGRDALQLFEKMQQEGLKPDGITFMSVLSGCSHGGLVDEGCHYFTSMSQDHALNPTVDHFGCIVDLFGRAGKLDEAEDFINKMPTKPGAGVWRALLSACRKNGDVIR